MTLSTPIKVIALAGLALILGGAGVLMLVSRHGGSTTIPPVQHTPATVVVNVSKTTPVAKKKPLELNPALPSAVAAKLRVSHKLVAFVYTGASASDRALLVEARAGAHAAHVPFVALNVTNERTAESVYSWLASSTDPAVLVVKRPGTVAFSSNGALDRSIVAQAAAEAR